MSEFNLETVIKIEPSDLSEFETENSQTCDSFLSSTLSDGYEKQYFDVKKESSFADEDSLEEYCFETDHPALKENRDYRSLIKTLAILEAQRSKAIQDLTKLHQLQREALADPIDFVERLQKKDNLDIPGPQQVYPVPNIDWEKYSLHGSSSAFGRRQLTRLSSKVNQDHSKFSTRGKISRVSEQSQSKSFKANQFWTAEEQKRLEELLVQFPPEEIETRRWEKIANCLENRTPIQVASRVQKYFIKLMKAGIPIPGRIPSSTYMKKSRRHYIRHQPSTFLVSHTLPVYMPDGEEFNYGYYHSNNTDENSCDSRIDISDEEDVSPELKETPEFKELMLLKKLQKEKINLCGLAQHIGYKCAKCRVEPILGVRWHCTECKPPLTVDFCEDCMESTYEVGLHSADHKLEEIPHFSSALLEQDYSSCYGNDYNYLDLNYPSSK